MGNIVRRRQMRRGRCWPVWFFSREVLLCTCASALGLMLGSLLLVAGWSSLAVGQEDAVIASVRKSSEQLATAFNAGKVDDLSAMFLPQSEMIDEEGAVYQGRERNQGPARAVFSEVPGGEAGHQYRVDPPGRTGRH